MDCMSALDLGGVAARRVPEAPKTLAIGTRARIWARVAAEFWPRDRGIAELRWAALTVAIMVALGVVATVLDPTGADFIRLLAVAVPSALLLIAAGWGRSGPRLVSSHAVRLALGPLVLAIAFVGAGSADIASLNLHAAAPLVFLAMTYAALTPGYPIAAACLTAACGVVLALHWQVAPGIGLSDDLSDEFVVGAVVTLIASAGMAGLLTIATKAEAEAHRLAARRRERLDALETLNRIIARFDGSQPVQVVIGSVVDDIAREFEITLVSMYLPIGGDRLSMVGVAGYEDPFHEIDIGVGIIGRAAATRQTQFVADVLADPDYRAARDDVRSEVAAPVVHEDELLGVVNFEGTDERPIGPAQVAVAEMVVHAMAASLRSARLDDERRQRLHAIERVLAVSRELVADLDRGRIVASIVDAAAELLTADVVALVSRRDDGVYRAEAGVGFPPAAIGSEVPSGHGLTGRCIADRARVVGVQEVEAWPPEYRADRPGGDMPHAGLALPIIVDGEMSAVLLVSRAGVERRFSELELGIADLLSAQVAIALRNADLHARVAESAVRDPLTGLLNRRYFDEAVESAYAAAVREKQPLSLIVLDLDRFSDVNNQYGHALGDSVLRRVARAIKGRDPRGRCRRALWRRGIRRHRAVDVRRWCSPGGRAHPDRGRGRHAGTPSTGSWCRSPSRPASPAWSTRPTDAASSGPPIRPCSRQNAQAETGSAGSSRARRPARAAGPAPPPRRASRRWCGTARA